MNLFSLLLFPLDSHTMVYFIMKLSSNKYAYIEELKYYEEMQEQHGI